MMMFRNHQTIAEHVMTESKAILATTAIVILELTWFEDIIAFTWM
jgi:hypothetical protein